MLSLEHARPFVGITEDKPETPRVPSGICLGLRKRLEGGTLAQIRQESLDRILYLDFSGYDELGNTRDYTLVFDGAGGKGGIGLLSGGITELSVTPARYRLEAGSPYIPPESTKHNLLLDPDLTRLAHQICSSNMPAQMALVSHVEGIGKEHASGILSWTGLPNRKRLTQENVEAVAGILEETKNLLIKGSSPLLCTCAGRESLCSAYCPCIIWNPQEPTGRCLKLHPDTGNISCTSWHLSQLKPRSGQCTTELPPN